MRPSTSCPLPAQPAVLQNPHSCLGCHKLRRPDRHGLQSASDSRCQLCCADGARTASSGSAPTSRKATSGFTRSTTRQALSRAPHRSQRACSLPQRWQSTCRPKNCVQGAFSKAVFDSEAEASRAAVDIWVQAFGQSQTRTLAQALADDQARTQACHSRAATRPARQQLAVVDFAQGLLHCCSACAAKHCKGGCKVLLSRPI